MLSGSKVTEMQGTSTLYVLTLIVMVASRLVDSMNTEEYVNACVDVIQGSILNPAPEPDPIAPDQFMVQFGTNCSTLNPYVPDDSVADYIYDPIILLVTRSWAPLGVDRFYSLIQDKYYDNAAFFRVVPNFVVQWGISANVSETAKWMNSTILDDPVVQSNVQWTVSYATGGNNTRSTQIFINTAENSRLDNMGCSPFAKVVGGFNTVLNLTNPTPGNSDGIDQDLYAEGGKVWIEENYPNVSIITCAYSYAMPVSTDDDIVASEQAWSVSLYIIATLGMLVGCGLFWYVLYSAFYRLKRVPVKSAMSKFDSSLIVEDSGHGGYTAFDDEEQQKQKQEQGQVQSRGDVLRQAEGIGLMFGGVGTGFGGGEYGLSGSTNPKR